MHKWILHEATRELLLPILILRVLNCGKIHHHLHVCWIRIHSAEAHLTWHHHIRELIHILHVVWTTHDETRSHWHLRILSTIASLLICSQFMISVCKRTIISISALAIFKKKLDTLMKILTSFKKLALYCFVILWHWIVILIVSIITLVNSVIIEVSLASSIKSTTSGSSIVKSSASYTLISSSSVFVELVLTSIVLFSFCKSSGSLLITILPLLRFQGHGELMISERIFRLSQFCIPMSEMTFVA